MKPPTQWVITWSGADGFELEGWYSGSERKARAFAREKKAELGAVTYVIKREEGDGRVRANCA